MREKKNQQMEFRSRVWLSELYFYSPFRSGHKILWQKGFLIRCPYETQNAISYLRLPISYFSFHSMNSDFNFFSSHFYFWLFHQFADDLRNTTKNQSNRISCYEFQFLFLPVRPT